MKTAIIHEWLVNYAGSERVLEQIVGLYPDSDLFCQVDFLRDDERGFVLNKKSKTSFIQNLPFAKQKYRNYLPFMPCAVSRFDVSGYDVIISNSHSVAKGIKKRSNQLQICYCHTPMRYVWDLQDQYLQEAGLALGLKGAIVKHILGRIREWDYKTAQQVDHFIANSHYIQDRIKRSYGRDSTVIYPPVDIEKYQLHDNKENYFLAASRMVSYKKMDMIVEAFSENGLQLLVIGDGPDLEKVKSRAKKNVEFLGFQKDEAMINYMQRARAFIFAAEEDFGIVPVEAQACGTPVIAYGKGGITETVVPFQGTEKEHAPTGIFFNEQTTSALIDAVKQFEAVKDQFDPREIRKNAERFSIDRFQKELKNYIEAKAKEYFK